MSTNWITAAQARHNSDNASTGRDEILDLLYRNIKVISETGTTSMSWPFGKQVADKQVLQQVIQHLQSDGYQAELTESNDSYSFVIKW